VGWELGRSADRDGLLDFDTDMRVRLYRASSSLSFLVF
jgi:hypothetical protein